MATERGFEIGDRVRFRNRRNKFKGVTGVIVEIDHNWVEAVWDDDGDYGGAYDDELELIAVEQDII
jgi:hypothetical protein